MKLLHTPGPWHVKAVSYPERAHPQVYAGDQRVAEPCNSKTVPAPESDANARLIAAAPELLGICIGMLECLDEKDRWTSPVRKRTAHHLREIIAKARGETP